MRRRTNHLNDWKRKWVFINSQETVPKNMMGEAQFHHSSEYVYMHSIFIMFHVYISNGDNLKLCKMLIFGSVMLLSSWGVFM